MPEQLAHIIHQDGATFAALLVGDGVKNAIEVEGADASALNDDVCQAILSGNIDLAYWLTDELAYGRAAIIGAYFEVNL